MVVLIVICIYFAVLMLFSRITSRSSDNNTFFRAGRRSPWYMVAFGMVGASISGVTFVSVPGMVIYSDMTYLQTCLGFILGYFAVAFVLLPVYYRLNLTTIYSFLGQRLGVRSYKTGAWFFLLSKMAGAAIRFSIVCLLLSEALAPLFPSIAPTIKLLSPLLLVSLIWLYTRRGGIRTLVWTDTFQTVCMLTALLLIIYNVVIDLGLTPLEAINSIAADSHNRVFVFDDWLSSQNFWKQFLSGVFIVIVMTGLDQDMMQKNLTCKTLRYAQKDMSHYGLAFVPVNLLFLSLGVLLMMWYGKQGMPLPVKGDTLLPQYILSSTSYLVPIVFSVGIVAASFSSADSALTALTTTYCVDIRGRVDDEQLRRRVHLCMALVFALIIIGVGLVGSSSIIDTIYVLCGYTYGPLLGLFAFGLFTRRRVRDKFVPHIAVASPVLCYIIEEVVAATTSYHFGYELLMLNGVLTFAGLVSISLPQEQPYIRCRQQR